MKPWLSIFALLAACSAAPTTSPDSGGTDGTHADTPGGGSVLYPLAMGNRWTYTVTAVGGGAVCGAGSHAQQIVSTNAIGGRTAFQMTSFCTGIAGANSYASSGDEVDFYYQGAWAMFVDPMLVEGHSWTYFNTSYHWQRATSVTVPSGTYHDCWTAMQNVGYTAYLTYCRGVGLVRSYSSDLGGNGWDAQLATFVH